MKLKSAKGLFGMRSHGKRLSRRMSSERLREALFITSVLCAKGAQSGK